MNLEVGQIDIEASQWLERVVENYHACLHRSPEAQGHLRSLGINALKSLHLSASATQTEHYQNTIGARSPCIKAHRHIQ
jgi:hypothetical protein